MLFGLAMLAWDMSAGGISGSLCTVILEKCSSGGEQCCSVTKDRNGPSELGGVCWEVVGSTASSHGTMQL